MLATTGSIKLAWNLQPVDTGSGRVDDFAFAFGPDGFPAIAFTVDSRTLKLARYNGNAWGIATVEAAGDHPADTCGRGLSLSFDHHGNPAISYNKATLIDSSFNVELRLARYAASGWDHSTIASAPSATGLGFFTSGHRCLKFGPDGEPAIVHRPGVSGVGVCLARKMGGTWSSNPVDPSGKGDEADLAFSPGGISTIAYDEDSSTKFAKLNGALWEISILPRNGRWPSLAYGPDGSPSIAYNGSFPGTIRPERTIFARLTNGAWEESEVENLGARGGPSLSFGPDGYPAVAYHVTTSPATGALKFAHFDGRDWQLEVAADIEYRPGGVCLLAFGSDGLPTCAYTDSLRNAPALAWKGTFRPVR